MKTNKEKDIEEKFNTYEQLMAMADPQYQAFSLKLVPNADPVLGVRMPIIRKISQEIANNDFRKWLSEYECTFHEETLIRGLVIGYAAMEVEERLECIREFIPKIQNWAVCDSFCSQLKFTSKHKDQVWEFVQPYLNSKYEFEVRFAVVMSLCYFIDEQHIKQLLSIFDQITHDGYYAKMAVAWAISVCYVTFPELTRSFLTQDHLDDFTHNKSLQKITESYRISTDEKIFVRTLKRKSNGNFQ